MSSEEASPKERSAQILERSPTLRTWLDEKKWAGLTQWKRELHNSVLVTFTEIGQKLEVEDPLSIIGSSLAMMAWDTIDFDPRLDNSDRFNAILAMIAIGYEIGNWDDYKQFQSLVCLELVKIGWLETHAQDEEIVQRSRETIGTIGRLAKAGFHLRNLKNRDDLDDLSVFEDFINSLPD